MGTWGTPISSNDTYADVYAEFFELYDDGLPVSEISTKLAAMFRETIDDPDDANNFWFALGKAQWECKELDSDVLRKIERIVESGTDIEIWRRLDATEGDLKKRTNALEKFVTKLRSEKPRARKRKKRVIHQPVFEKGECLVFRLADGNYGGAAVLEAVPCIGFGLNLVATSRINQPNRPVAVDFLNADVLMKSFAAWDYEPEIGWFYSTGFEKEKHLFESIGKIVVKKTYNADNYSQGFFFGGQWSSMIDAVGLQFEAEGTDHPQPVKRIRIKDLVDKNRWKFWK